MTSSGGAQPGSLVPPRDVTTNTSLGINTVIRHPHDNGGVTCHVDTVYEPTTAAVCAVYIVIGLLYTFIGYRCFKTTMFLTGFIFASSLVYLICLQGELLPPYGNAGVALFAGLLFGLITMLVQYVGLFMGGLHTGLLLAVVGLLAADHVTLTSATTATSPSQQQQQQRGSVWLCVGVLLTSALCFASLNLYFRRALTVVGSVVYGAAMVMVACDYYVEHLASLSWLWERVSLRPPVAPPCWYSWLVLAVWPSLTLLGLPVQCLLTGRGLHHDDDVAAGRKKPSCRPGGGGGGGHHGGGKGTAAIVGGGGGSDRAQLRQNKYRYLYQVRTAHGDVISQNYVQALQRGGGGGGGGNLANTTGGGSVLSEEGAGECSTLQSDATHLTILPDHQLPILTESEDDSSSVSSLSEMTPSTVTASVVAGSNATVNLTASNAVMQQQRTQQYHHHHHHNNNNIRYS